MKKALLVLLVGALLLQALPAFAQEAIDNGNETESVNKNYAFSVWATGGMYKNKFSFTFEGAYARNFSGMFGQVAVMTNHYDGMGEYGLSLGIGQQNTEFEWYVFADSVYNTYLWTQIRAMFRLNLGWLNAGGTYTVPLQKSVKYNDTQEMRIEPVRKLDLSIIPFSFLRIYGNFYLIGKGNLQQKFDFGVEICPVRIFSLRVDWNKSSWKQESVRDLNANWSLYSGWHMQNDFRITLNLILGSSRDLRHYPKKGNTRIVETLWPYEVAALQNSSDEDTTPRPITVKIDYGRWVPGGYYPFNKDYPPIIVLNGARIYSELKEAGENKYSISVNIETYTSYVGYISDRCMGENVASYVWINGILAINLDGDNTPYGTFRFHVKNDGTVVFQSQ
jgi:hypothetical protein